MGPRPQIGKISGRSPGACWLMQRCCKAGFDLIYHRRVCSVMDICRHVSEICEHSARVWWTRFQAIWDVARNWLRRTDRNCSIPVTGGIRSCGLQDQTLRGQTRCAPSDDRAYGSRSAASPMATSTRPTAARTAGLWDSPTGSTTQPTAAYAQWGNRDWRRGDEGVGSG